MSVYWCVQTMPWIDRSGSVNGDEYAYQSALEQKMGRRFVGERCNKFGAGSLPYFHAWAQKGRPQQFCYGNGHLGSGGGGMYWRDVAAGKFDAALKADIAKIMADPLFSATNPYHMSFHHEQSVVSEAPGGADAGKPADYAAAFRHVASVVKAQNAHASQGGKILLCYVPMWSQFYYDPHCYPAGTSAPRAPSGSNVGSYTASACYPGDDVVDIQGVDMYTRTTSNGALQRSAAQSWNPVHYFASQHGKPMMTGEHGIQVVKNQANDTSCVKYLADLDALIRKWGTGNGAGQILALCWTLRLTYPGASNEADNRLDGRPAIWTKFSQLARDPLYNAGL